jgi:hypothetical protein
VRVELPPGLPDRIGARAYAQRPARRRTVWLGVSAGAALAAGLFIVVSLHGTRSTASLTDVAALSSWRSPTASLLVSSNVLTTPFTLRGGIRAGAGRFHS